MNEEIANALLSLNKTFYSQFADPFALSRGSPQPGFKRLLKEIPPSLKNVLDVGCGNGRFGHFLKDQIGEFDYVGVDFSSELLNKAEKNFIGTFVQRDISRPDFLKDLECFDLIVCLATMQHIPGKQNRKHLLREMGSHLTDKGVIFLANWQFMDSPRQRRKLRDWSLIGLDAAEVEPNDYLLSWQRDGFGLRYVCFIDIKETNSMALEAGLTINQQFYSDGKEGNLNLYTVMVKPK